MFAEVDLCATNKASRQAMIDRHNNVWWSHQPTRGFPVTSVASAIDAGHADLLEENEWRSADVLQSDSRLARSFFNITNQRIMRSPKPPAATMDFFGLSESSMNDVGRLSS